MTPKEKAESLVSLFKPLADWNNEYGSAEAATNAIKAKQCALIAVDEILAIPSELPLMEAGLLYTKYWSQVRNEIEKL